MAKIEQAKSLNIKKFTVIFHPSDRNEEIAEWCSENSQKYLESGNINGYEDAACVLLDCDLTPELITRARNLLVIVTIRFGDLLHFYKS